MYLLIMYYLRLCNASNPNGKKTNAILSNTRGLNQYYEPNNKTKCKEKHKTNLCTDIKQRSISKTRFNATKNEPDAIKMNALNQNFTNDSRKWVEIRKLNDINRNRNTRIKFLSLKIKNMWKKNIIKNARNKNRNIIFNKIVKPENKLEPYGSEIIKKVGYCANSSINTKNPIIELKNFSNDVKMTHTSLFEVFDKPLLLPDADCCVNSTPFNDVCEYVTTSNLQDILNQPYQNIKTEKDKAIAANADTVINISKNVDLYNNKNQSPSQNNQHKKAFGRSDVISKCHDNYLDDKNDIMNSNFSHQENNVINALSNEASNKNRDNGQFYHITAKCFDFDSKINISIDVVKRIDLTLSLDNFLLLQFLNTYTELQEYMKKIEEARSFNGLNSYIKMYNANSFEYINCFTTLELYNAGIYLYNVNISMRQYKNKIIYKIPLCSQNNMFANPIDDEDCMIISYLQKFVVGNFLEADFNINNLNMLIVEKLYKPDAFVRKNKDFIFLRKIVLQVLKNSTLETLTFFLELPSIIKHIETYEMKFNNHLYINYYVYTAFLNILNKLVELKWNYKENSFAFHTNYFYCFDYIKMLAKYDKQKMNFYMILLCVIRPFISPSKYKRICQKIILQGIFYYDSNKIKCNNFMQLESFKWRFFLFQLIEISIFLEDQGVFFGCRNGDSNMINFILKNYKNSRIKYLFQRKKSYTYIINNITLFCRYLELYNKNDHDNIFKTTLIDPLMKILLRCHKQNSKNSAKDFLFSLKDKRGKMNHVRLKFLDKIIDDVALIFIKHFVSFNTS